MRLMVFAGFRLPNSKEIEVMKSIGTTDVILGVTSNRNAEKGDFIFKEGDLKHAIINLNDEGFKVHIMLWIRRRDEYIDKIIMQVNNLAIWSKSIHGCKIRTIIFNAEGPFHTTVALAQRATSRLFEGINRAAKMEFKFGVVGLPYLNKAVRVLLDCCDFGIPEGYSFWKFTENGEYHDSHSPKLQPKLCQREAHRTWSKPDPAKPIIMGLACYEQKRPNMTAKESLQSCFYTTTKELNCYAVAYWDLKALYGSKTENANAETIAYLAKEFASVTPVLPF